MAGYIEDRWLTKRVDPATGKRRRTERYGKGLRYRVKNVPGVSDASFATLDEAKTWLADSQTDSRRGQFVDPRDGAVLLGDYVQEVWWPNLRVPPTTRESMKPRVFNHIVPHTGHLSLNQISSDEIKAWQTRVEQDLDAGTVRTVWRHFSSILESAVDAKRIPVNPFRAGKTLSAPAAPKAKAKAWALETVRSVQAALDDRYQILVDLSNGSGMRQGECFGFSEDDIVGKDIHVTRQIIRVNGQLAFAPPKGNKERFAPCEPGLALAVREHAARFPSVEVTLPWVDPDRPNLPWDKRPLVTVRLLVTTPRTGGKSGGALNRTTFNDKQWKPALVRAGVIPAPEIEPVLGKDGKISRRVTWDMPRGDGFHVLRHTFASVVLAAGETPGQLAEWLGHSDPAFTLRTYVHFMPKSGQAGRRALSLLLPGKSAVLGPEPLLVAAA